MYQKTSDIAYPERVLTVLDRADGVRSRLESWLSSLPDDYDTTLDFDMYQQRFINWQMPVDCSNRKIDGPVDLDLHVALLAKNQQLKFDQLPVTLTQEELLRLAMKSAALWSLRSFASEDSAVAALCDREATKSGGASRPLLAGPYST